jgi:hypothetical protein
MKLMDGEESSLSYTANRKWAGAEQIAVACNAIPPDRVDGIGQIKLWFQQTESGSGAIYSLVGSYIVSQETRRVQQRVGQFVASRADVKRSRYRR